MKMLEVQFAELKEKIVAAEVAKGFSEAAAETAIKDAGVFQGETIEQRLSQLKKHALKIGITESGRPARVMRKNGSAFNEGAKVDREGRILHYMESGFKYREACFMIGETPKGDVKQPASITEAFTAKWKKYAPWLSESDARTLGELGKSPE